VPILVQWLFSPTDYNNVLFITYNLPDRSGYLNFSTRFMKNVIIVWSEDSKVWNKYYVVENEKFIMQYIFKVQ